MSCDGIRFCFASNRLGGDKRQVTCTTAADAGWNAEVGCGEDVNNMICRSDCGGSSAFVPGAWRMSCRKCPWSIPEQSQLCPPARHSLARMTGERAVAATLTAKTSETPGLLKTGRSERMLIDPRRRMSISGSRRWRGAVRRLARRNRLKRGRRRRERCRRVVRSGLVGSERRHPSRNQSR
jgi:hypothetical protein